MAFVLLVRFVLLLLHFIGDLGYRRKHRVVLGRVAAYSCDGSGNVYTEQASPSFGVVSQEVVPRIDAALSLGSSAVDASDLAMVLLRELEIWGNPLRTGGILRPKTIARKRVFQVVEHERPVERRAIPVGTRTSRRSARPIPNNIVPSGGTKYPGGVRSLDSAVF
ncbi:hypothetical protein B0H14DRAFT_2569886 [Mycena olivaceomarginata]|nr:hypothetical protein B0H14DRAFT_2569886 [Mycena olivaceomarginata]